MASAHMAPMRAQTAEDALPGSLCCRRHLSSSLCLVLKATMMTGRCLVVERSLRQVCSVRRSIRSILRFASVFPVSAEPALGADDIAEILARLPRPTAPTYSVAPPQAQQSSHQPPAESVAAQATEPLHHDSQAHEPTDAERIHQAAAERAEANLHGHGGYTVMHNHRWWVVLKVLKVLVTAVATGSE